MRAKGLFLLLILAVGAVGLVHLLLADAGELFRRRRKPSKPESGDPWETASDRRRPAPSADDDEEGKAPGPEGE